MKYNLQVTGKYCYAGAQIKKPRRCNPNAGADDLMLHSHFSKSGGFFIHYTLPARLKLFRQEVGHSNLLGSPGINLQGFGKADHGSFQVFYFQHIADAHLIEA